MNETLYILHIPFVDRTLVITAMKMIGMAGSLMFGGRWLVQAAASHFARRPVIPSAFWYISVLGSAFTFSYFLWGKNDAVGIMTTFPPLVFACYNLYLHYTHKRNDKGDPV